MYCKKCDKNISETELTKFYDERYCPICGNNISISDTKENQNKIVYDLKEKNLYYFYAWSLTMAPPVAIIFAIYYYARNKRLFFQSISTPVISYVSWALIALISYLLDPEKKLRIPYLAIIIAPFIVHYFVRNYITSYCFNLGGADLSSLKRLTDATLKTSEVTHDKEEKEFVCSECNTPVKLDDKICPKCGKKL